MNTHPISRRVVLKGLGATVALPWLESLSAWLANARHAPRRRSDSPSCSSATAFIRRNGGPAATARTWSLAPHSPRWTVVKDKVNFIHGLRHPGNVCDGHAKGAAGILSGIHPNNGREIRAAASLDQVLARRIGDATALPSLVVACERPVSGFHESGYSMMYASHVSWSSPVTPVPAELYPALAFDTLFESRGNRTQASVLDHVSEQLRDVSRNVSGSDRARIDEYANSIREVEGRLARLQANEGAGPSPAIRAQRPANGVPTHAERARPVDVRHHRAGVPDRPHADRDDAADEQSLRPGLSVPRLARRPPQLFAQLPRPGIRVDQPLLGGAISRICSADWRPRRKATARSSTTAASCWPTNNGPSTTPRRSRCSWAADSAAPSARAAPSISHQSRNRKFSSLLMTLADRMGLRLDRFGDSTEQLDI